MSIHVERFAFDLLAFDGFDGFALHAVLKA